MLEELLDGNREFAERTPTELPMLPRKGLVVVTCMDHRIDPAAALGLELADAMVLRNAGGRVTPALLKNLEIQDLVARERGAALADLELVLMHTECGAGGLADSHPNALAEYLGAPPDQLPAKAPTDPQGSAPTSRRSPPLRRSQTPSR